ncbi:phosphoadenylyl-sulfate reductase [Micromonospora sp. NPDC049051]|uniref:phosphoadenylyl-sulfate reductase n=1 Tax=unclassified Micromonospora TaxID=2617518 RepID=UPI0037241C92
MITTGRSARSGAGLPELAEQAGHELEDAPAEEVLRWAADAFGPRFCVTSSLADTVLIHLAARTVPGVDVIFLDTGLHFPETLAVRDRVTATLPVTLRSVRPELTVAEQDRRYGPRLHERDPDSCCDMRKVQPLRAALERYDAWAAGLRRDESPSRADTPVVHYEHARRKVKVNPLARWTDEDVARYLARHDVPVNDLRARGYASIGCQPCTRPVRDGEDPRAGRWAMFDKTECGLHT